MNDVLEDCLARLPDTHAIVCVSLEDARVLAAASRDDEDERLAQLGVAAAELFRSGSFANDADDSGGAATEALVSGPQHALIFLRAQKRQDVAVAYLLDRSADLGMALATSRLSLAEIDAAM